MSSLERETRKAVEALGQDSTLAEMRRELRELEIVVKEFRRYVTNRAKGRKR